MIVSLHLPKTAGSSFRGALQTHYGDHLALDYADKPLGVSAQAAQRHALSAGQLLKFSDFEGVICVHGHFLACKYLHLAEQCDVDFVTWLREPIQRLYSHYCYWREPVDEDSVTALRRQMLAEAWSFREFALHPQLRNLYSRFMWQVPLESFVFVGITENYEPMEVLLELQYLALGVKGPGQTDGQVRGFGPGVGEADLFHRRHKPHYGAITGATSYA